MCDYCGCRLRPQLIASRTVSSKQELPAAGDSNQCLCGHRRRSISVSEGQHAPVGPASCGAFGAEIIDTGIRASEVEQVGR
jgi:hypothetical protein